MEDVSTFTPPPLILRKEGPNKFNIRKAISGASWSVAEVTCEGDANLYVAAPDMFEALLDALDYIYNVGRDSDMAPVVSRIENALRKAKGKEVEA